MYKIVYEPEAENDLVEILYYYAENGGINIAEAINLRIKNHIKKLESMPYRIADSLLVPNVKGYLIENLPYWAYFQIDEYKKEIYILNIVHTRRKFL